MHPERAVGHGLSYATEFPCIEARAQMGDHLPTVLARAWCRFAATCSVRCSNVITSSSLDTCSLTVSGSRFGWDGASEPSATVGSDIAARYGGGGGARVSPSRHTGTINGEAREMTACPTSASDSRPSSALVSVTRLQWPDQGGA